MLAVSQQTDITASPRAELLPLPICLRHLSDEPRWVAWRWVMRNGKRTKPPISVVGGRECGYARNDDPATWATVAEASEAMQCGHLDGIGLQLLGLMEFAAVDLDDVRNPETGQIKPWAGDLVTRCNSYTEITPSQTGLRILGAVGRTFPATHIRRSNPEGGSYEIYANITTGRYITVSGERLADMPDKLARIDAHLQNLLDADRMVIPESPNPRVSGDTVAAAFAMLPHAIQVMIGDATAADRSISFQSIVNRFHREGIDPDIALKILQSHPEGPASKYDGRLETEFRRSWQKVQSAPALATASGGNNESASSGLGLSEDTLARLLAENHRGYLHFDHDRKQWWRWLGDRWQPDTQQWSRHELREMAREMSSNANARERITAGRASFVDGAEKLARADPLIAVSGDIWNDNPLLLGVPGGVVVLRNGRMREAKPSDFMTFQTPVAPSEAIGCPQWLDFLHDATGGDDQFIAYLQRLVGYCLTGKTHEHTLAFLYGPGGNGKSVFVNVIRGLLGDYAKVAPMETFAAGKFDRHPTELAMLKDARLVTAVETEGGRAWAESRIKQLTGGDPVAAHFMRQDYFTFTPKFKLMFMGNHRPSVHAVDDAIRRRFHIIPFTRQPANPDPHLTDKLRFEWPAILHWAIEGCLEWQKLGLAPPPVVRAETENYFETQDLLGQWIEEECDIQPDNKRISDPIAQLYASWRMHAEAAGELPGSKKAFGDALQKRGYESKKAKVDGKSTRVRIGIKLRRGRGTIRYDEDAR